MGRGLESDVRVTDISVSRSHADIQWSPKGDCYIKDTMSKFGTFLMIKEPLLLNENQRVTIGRSILEFDM